MGRASLEGVDLKLNRAADCFHTLSKSISEFLTHPDSHTLALESHAQRRGQFRITDVRPPPPDWGLLISECVHHYRSALDHLVFQLILANTTGRLPAKVEKRSEFPIFNSGPKFRGRPNRKGVLPPNCGRAKIQDIAPAAQAVIERLQPYHRRKCPGSRSLWQLQELANIDKHRILHVTYASIRGTTFTVTGHQNIAALQGFEFRPGPLKRNAVLADWQIIPVDPRFGTHVKMEVDMVADVVFGKASPARAVRGEALSRVIYDVGAFIASEVLPPLTEILGLTSEFRPGLLVDAESLSTEEREALGERTLVQNLSSEPPTA